MSEAEIDSEALRRFERAMWIKLCRKRDEGRSGWHDDEQCKLSYLYELLGEHVRKGDMVDIANIAMMIWNREEDLWGDSHE